MSKWKQFRHKVRRAVVPVRSSDSSDFLPGNQVTLVHGGETYFQSVEAAFDRARYEIFVETYIYEDDANGRRIAEALKRAVLRGVRVYLLIDGYGSKDLPKAMLGDLIAGGVKTLVFRPRISPWTFRRVRLRRMHRKIVVVDQQIAFVGGINIVDDGNATDGFAPRYDYAVAVEGPLVEEIRLAAKRLWSLVSWSRLRKGTIHGAPPGPTATAGHVSAAFLIRDNLRHRRDIETAYLRAIGHARSEIILAHAYFLPGIDFRRALVDAAGRGVRVMLLLQGKVEYVLQHYASHALYGNLLDAGVEIYEYSKGFLHAKVAVIDGHWATVGSSNIDPFSLLLSREANVVVDDQVFAAALAQSLKQTIETDSERVQSASWKQKPATLRFISWISYGLLRLITGISGYSREDNSRR
jgi:cardiolipin synthase A/B